MQRNVLQNIIQLVMGTGFSQALIIISSPILTRIYTPEDFGLFSVFTSVVGILMIIASGKYEMSIVLPKKISDARTLLTLSILLTLFTSSIVLIIMIIFNDLFSSVLFSNANNTISTFLLYLIPVNVFFLVLYRTQKQWQTKLDNYKVQTRAEISRSVTGVSTQLFLGFSSLGALGLVFGQLVGQLTSNAILNFKSGLSFNNLRKSIDKRELKKVAKNYQDFPKYDMPLDLITSGANSMLPILITSLFNPSITGFYSLANRVTNLPSSVLSDAVKTVTYKRLADLRNEGKKLFGFLWRSTVAISLVMLIPIFIIVFFAPELFSLVFGKEWRVAGVYAQWLMPIIAMRFINKPAYSVVKVFQWQKYLLIVNVFISVSRLLAFILGAISKGALFGIALYSLVGATFTLMVVLIIINKVRLMDKI